MGCCRPPVLWNRMPACPSLHLAEAIQLSKVQEVPLRVVRANIMN